MIELELHSNHPEVVEATRSTIKLLGDDLIEKDGKFFVSKDFTAWAAVRQGYVKRRID